MDTKDFLQKVLPSEGLNTYCLFGIKDKQKPQVFFDTIDSLVLEADRLIEKQFNVFMALGVFKASNRTAENCTHLKSFFLDLDCGEDRDFPSKEEALTQLVGFLEKTKLPRPMLVDSGRGIHCYWPLDKDIAKEDWLPVAQKLKALCLFHDFQADPSVPADAARVLRMVGSNNHKEETPYPVIVLRDGPVREWSKIKALIEEAHSEFAGFDLQSAKRELDEDTKALLKLENYDSSFKKIVRKSINGQGCAQILHIVTEQEECSEPLWRAGLSVAYRCEDGQEAIHLMSQEYSGYSAEVTEEKAAATKGPYTCQKFLELNPKGCEGCPNRGKISSPIQLGKVMKKAQPQVTGINEESEGGETQPVQTPQRMVEFPDFLYPFMRGANGGIYFQPPPEVDKKTKKRIEFDPVQIYENDFYVVKRMFDPVDGECVLMRVDLPKDGVREFLMPLKHVNSNDKFREITAQNGVAFYKYNQERLMEYTTKWIKYLQSQQEAAIGHMQMGWTADNKAFVLGDKEYRKDGVFDTAPTNTTREITKYIRMQGTFEEWRNTFNIMARPGFELHAFGALVGFGTPLLKFTKLDGCLINLCNPDPGTGKTASLYFCNSIWGNPKDLTIAESTYNAKFNRLGVMNNLPMTIDEISNIQSKELSNWAYHITSGKGKIRMVASANQERANFTTWSTMSLSTSNTSFYEILSRDKAAAGGEIVRALEFIIRKPKELNSTTGREFFNPIHEHHGHAGPIYAQWLVNQTQEDLLARVERWMNRVTMDFGNSSEKRFWVASVACIFAGAEIAQELDLHDINLNEVYKAVIREVLHAEQTSNVKRAKAEDLLSDFINLNINNLLKIKGGKDDSGLGHKLPTIIPKGRLVMRYEPDTETLYIVKKEMDEYLAKHSFSTDMFATNLMASGMLLDKRYRKDLGAGWEGGVGRQLGWTYKIHFPELNAEGEDHADAGAGVAVPVL